MAALPVMERMMPTGTAVIQKAVFQASRDSSQKPVMQPMAQSQVQHHRVHTGKAMAAKASRASLGKKMMRPSERSRAQRPSVRKKKTPMRSQAIMLWLSPCWMVCDQV